MEIDREVVSEVEAWKTRSEMGPSEWMNETLESSWVYRKQPCL